MSKERPILFSGPMIRAIREGRKTQTRRVVKPQPVKITRRLHEWQATKRHSAISSTTYCWGLESPANDRFVSECCPYGVPGDVLWVKESHRFAKNQPLPKGGIASAVRYEADGELSGHHGWGNLRPSIHMPRSASRVTLKVTGVRAERLDAITDADCVAEGCAGGNESIPNYPFSATPREHYRHVWESINGKGSWDANPWVWVVEFKRIAQAVSA